MGVQAISSLMAFLATGKVRQQPTTTELWPFGIKLDWATQLLLPFHVNHPINHHILLAQKTPYCLWLSRLCGDSHCIKSTSNKLVLFLCSKFVAGGVCCHNPPSSCLETTMTMTALHCSYSATLILRMNPV